MYTVPVLYCLCHSDGVSIVMYSRCETIARPGIIRVHVDPFGFRGSC